MNQNRIESSPEIEAFLKALLEKLKADTAILYKYIDVNDLEETELLDLISKSPVIKKNPDFLTEVIKPEKGLLKREGGLQKLVDDYENGTLRLDDKVTKADLLQLKHLIRVLRFCDLAEKKPEESRWDFDYAKRPPKYLVFSDKLLNKNFRKNPIQYEGVTSYFLRTRGTGNPLYQPTNENPGANKEALSKTSTADLPSSVMNPNSFLITTDPASWLLSRDEIDRSIAHSKFGDDTTVYSNYDSHHAIWLLLEKAEDRDVIGCLRLEYYPETSYSGEQTRIEQFKEKTSELLMSVSVRPVTDLFVSEIQNVLAKQKEFSYSKQFHCLEPILKQLKKIGIELKAQLRKPKTEDEKTEKELTALNQVHNLLEHLFYVLKRNTYYGEAILSRINRFIGDLLKAVSLPEDIFLNVWESLKKHEDLMLYSIDNYRDHFMHQFHVFVTGYMLIYSYGIDRLLDLINRNYGEFVQSDDDKDKVFTKIDVIRIWTLAALFHDCGYAFEKLPDGFETFSKRVLGTNLKSHFFWDEVILRSGDIPGTLQKISEYFRICPVCSSGFNQVDLFRILIQQAIKNNDHGVISAIILMQQYLNYSKGHVQIDRIEPIMNIAALAIALHNKSVFESVKKQGNQRICIRYNPIMFILAYCDLVQEWGRKKTIAEDKQIATPHLQNLSFPDIPKDDNPSDDTDSHVFNVELFYPSHSKGLPPNANKIKEALDPALTTFSVSPDSTFSINYNIRNSAQNSFKPTFYSCGSRCDESEKDDHK